MSCQDICMVADYDGSAEFYSAVTRRAAKEHRCEECRDVIAVGEQYEYVSAKWDGDFTTLKTCLACVEIRKAFYCGGELHGNLWEDIAEQMFPYWNEVTAIDCLAKLTTDAAIAKARARFAKWQAVCP